MEQEKVSQKLALLLSAEKTLKQEFVGLNKEISQICELIRPWFLLPESLNKPIVINLWGITGVGKTTLVRRLVELLEVSSNFGEFDLGKFAEVPKFPENFLEEFFDKTEAANVFLFDEFQTVKTVSSLGEDPRVMMRDIWSLLSDGQVNFNINVSQFRQNFITEILPQFKKDSQSPRLSGYEAGRMFILLKDTYYKNFKEFFKDFSNNPEIIIEKIIEYLDKAPPRKTINLSKSLIFISGNIDDIFAQDFFQKIEGFSADDLHLSLRKVTPLKIKQFLKRYFRPEQIARLGNNHLVFPSFSSEDYKRIIETLVTKSAAFFETKTQKKLLVDLAIQELIFKEGVQPIQGIRPLLSTYGQIIDSQLPELILHSLTLNGTDVSLKLNSQTNSLEAIFSLEKKIVDSKQIPLLLSAPPQEHSPEVLHLIIHHEAAHAIVGWSTLRQIPLVVRTKTPMLEWGGQVIFPTQELPTYSTLLNTLATLLAGYVLEKKLFKDVSIGSAIDLQNATLLASRMVRELGMGTHLGFSQATLEQNTLTTFNQKDDQEIEKLLQAAAKIAWRSLRQQKKLYYALVKTLQKHSSVTPEQFYLLTEKFGNPSSHLSSRRQHAHRAKDRRTN